MNYHGSIDFNDQNYGDGKDKDIQNGIRLVGWLVLKHVNPC